MSRTDPDAPDLDALAAEVLARCEALGPRERAARAALTRTFLSPPMRRVHGHLAGWMARAGMRVRVDPAGQPDRPLPGGRRPRGAPS